MQRNVTVGLAALAGVALLEAALIPGVALGAAAVLAPKYLSKLSRGLKPLFRSNPSKQIKPRSSSSGRSIVKALPAAAPEMPQPSRLIIENRPQALLAHADAESKRFEISNALVSDEPAQEIGRELICVPRHPVPVIPAGQAIAQPLTFRVIIVSFDFGVNYAVICELATAAGRSVFALFVGPGFQFVRQFPWNTHRPNLSAVRAAVALPKWSEADAPASPQPEMTMGERVAQTITACTIAAASTYATNCIAASNAMTAAALSAFAFALSPFAFFGQASRSGAV